MAGFGQPPNPHDARAFPMKDASPPSAAFGALLWGRLEPSWVGGHALLYAACSQPRRLAAISGSCYPTDTTSFHSPAGKQNLQPWQ